ncbi:hypothetical protein HAZT_HAZT008266 [Hyalella azteca]|uniref:Uncharacterized protein n=1 Tax=Hyalella azteca TaxID=294128 RepID=A0A6A0HCM4_HYAAZ|nr:hypothetical protein HAZT_HAZT008266 [Hyalella azteca]
MYSCADPKDMRQDHLRLILAGNISAISDPRRPQHAAGLLKIVVLVIIYIQSFLARMSETSGLMNQGLWVGTIACLCVGLLFAIAGAIFAIINTATTPVELITGVPGLYIWNSLAAVFTLVAVVLWSVLYHTSLSHNVLIEQSKDGWTTEGNEALGYSFWCVPKFVQFQCCLLQLLLLFNPNYQ